MYKLAKLSNLAETIPCFRNQTQTPCRKKGGKVFFIIKIPASSHWRRGDEKPALRGQMGKQLLPILLPPAELTAAEATSEVN